MDVRQFALEPNDARRLASLCGRQDTHLRLIESRLPVTIRNRGNQFEIEGEGDATKACVRLLDQLYRETRDSELTDDTVHLHLQEASTYQEDAQALVVIDTPKLKIKPRGQNQLGYINAIEAHDVNFGIGPAGTGKTWLAVACAVDALRRDQVERIILVRPAVEAGERLAVASSGNRLALQMSRLSVDHNIASRMSADCLSYAARTSDRAKAIISRRVISLDWPDREAMRQAKFRTQFWPNDMMQFADAGAASDYAGIKLPMGGVLHPYGRVIDPTLLTRFLAKDSQTSFNFHVVEIGRDDTEFHVVAKDGRRVSCDQLVFAGGADLDSLNRLLAVTGIAIDITSGQVSHVPETNNLVGLRAGISYGGYLTPAKGGYHELGATFDRSAGTEILATAHYHNRDLLPTGLAVQMPDPKAYGARISRRASTPDRNPFCGEIAANLYVLGALGARGLTLAPLLGDMLAAQMLDMPVTLGLDIRGGIDPYRFRRRVTKFDKKADFASS